MKGSQGYFLFLSGIVGETRRPPVSEIPAAFHGAVSQ
jgi:hypothetical protein